MSSSHAIFSTTLCSSQILAFEQIKLMEWMIFNLIHKSLNPPNWSESQIFKDYEFITWNFSKQSDTISKSINFKLTWEMETSIISLREFIIIRQFNILYNCIHHKVVPSDRKCFVIDFKMIKLLKGWMQKDSF